jgi:transcription elongation factor GreA
VLHIRPGIPRLVIFYARLAMSVPISREGFLQLHRELANLKKERPKIIELIKDAREEGDLKENAGYDAARERQSMLEARISHLESRLAQLNVIDIDNLSADRAIFGATVTIVDVDSDEQKTFTLLGPDEADYASGSISVQSPMGAAILGKQVGDEFVVDAPRGRLTYEVLHIAFKTGTGSRK